MKNIGIHSSPRQVLSRDSYWKPIMFYQLSGPDGYQVAFQIILKLFNGRRTCKSRKEKKNICYAWYQC